MALGRGLSELLGEIEAAYQQDSLGSKTNSINNSIEIPLDKIIPNPYQPRKIFHKQKLLELSESIRQHGLIQPIVVVLDEKNNYILLAGERRLRASQMIGLSCIKANILDIDPKYFRELAIIENIQREDLNIMELAYSYAKLINEHSLTHEDLALRMAKSRTSITNTLRLLTLSSEVQHMIGTNQISAGHAKVIVGIDEADQVKIAKMIIEKKMSVRETEKFIQSFKNNQLCHYDDSATEEKKSLEFKELESVLSILAMNNISIVQKNNKLIFAPKSQADIERFRVYFESIVGLN